MNEIAKDGTLDNGDGEYDRFRIRDCNVADQLQSILVQHDQSIRRFLGMPVTLRVHHMCFVTRYQQGGHLDRHCDGTIFFDDEHSIASILVYLNDDYEGGELVFDNGTSIRSNRGDVILLKQDVFHVAQCVTAGHKWLIRSDVMVKNT
jgi:predicted 2-oxoglutarate/Fe(II)-dependent dioxygenase YbiX